MPDLPTCPRCGRRTMPTRPGDPGALSRADNATYVCSECGADEGLRALAGAGVQPVSEWPVRLVFRILREPEVD